MSTPASFSHQIEELPSFCMGIERLIVGKGFFFKLGQLHENIRSSNDENNSVFWPKKYNSFQIEVLIFCMGIKQGFLNFWLKR